MLRPFTAALAALCLAGCGGELAKDIDAASNFTITQNNVDAARSAYVGAFLTPVARYRAFGVCPAGVTFTIAKPCADRAKLVTLASAARAVRAAFDATQAQLDAGNASGISAAYTALQTAITAAEALSASLPTANQ